ncbi:MAG TPA: hypothetical protein VGH80_07650 [Xanthomonadaceae bacterium]
MKAQREFSFQSEITLALFFSFFLPVQQRYAVVLSDCTATMTQTASPPDGAMPYALIGATGKREALVRLAFAMALPFVAFGVRVSLLSATRNFYWPRPHCSDAAKDEIVFLIELCAGIGTGAIFRRQPSRITAFAMIGQTVILAAFASVDSSNMVELLSYALMGSGLFLGALFVERWPAISSRWSEAGRLAGRLAVVVVAAAAILINEMAHYLPLRSERISHQLCDSIQRGDDFAPVVEKARVIGMNHRSHANHNEFWVGGWAGRYAACEIWTEKGKVDYKVASTTGMVARELTMGLTPDVPSH